MGITITLSKIKAHDPIGDGWETILAATHLHGGDYEKPFLLSDALETNGLGDTLWALRCLPEHGRLWRKYAVWLWRNGPADGISTKAWSELVDEAWDAAWYEVRGEVRGKEWDETWAAAWDAARAAQSKKLRQILDSGKWVD